MYNYFMFLIRKQDLITCLASRKNRTHYFLCITLTLDVGRVDLDGQKHIILIYYIQESIELFLKEYKRIPG